MAAYIIGESRDTAAIKPLLNNILDPRMSTHIKFKGMTVCYAKLMALKKISGRQPGWESEQSKVDTVAAVYYLNWATDENFINTMDEINLNAK